MKSAHGLVIGKFWPPHAGHHLLIRTAAAACAQVSVIVMAARHEGLSLEDRMAWLADAHADTPHVAILGIRDDVPVDYDDARIWDQHVQLMREALGPRRTPPVTAVFTAETYGLELARRFSARAVTLDPDRALLPVSGTAVRADPLANWHHLAPAARAGLARRVVVVGAESSGTTTLSSALARHWCARGAPHHETRWVAEYGRDYTVEKLCAAQAGAQLDGRPVPGMDALEWTTADFERIACVQNDLESTAARQGGPLLICDTDAWATAVWHERYLGHEAASVRAIAARRRAHLYLVTDDQGVPFHQDGIRDGERFRRWMTGRFLGLLDELGIPYLRLQGPHGERLEAAVAATRSLLESGWPELRARSAGEPG